MTVHDNIVMATIERDSNFHILNETKNRTISDTAIKTLNIRVFRTVRWPSAGFPVVTSRNA